MKFGKELDKRSILKWKHNNIHYNDLKYKIKLATTIQHDSISSESSSSTTVDSINLKHKSTLKDLYHSFAKEIEFLSLFVNTENEKLTHQLINLRHKLEQFLITYSDDTAEKSQSYNSIKNKSFVRCCNEANILLDNFNDLSQFINLQKLLLRKLFKKFIKYSSLSNKQDFIQHIKEKYLDGKTNSFININLNDAIQELSLIIDVLNSINENKKISIPSTLDSKLYTKTTKFDIMSTVKGSFQNSFLVHNDNLSELKIKLLKEFDLICDDEGANNLKFLKKTTSHLNLQNSTRSVHSVNTNDTTEIFQPDNEIDSMILSSSLDKTHSSITNLTNNEFLLMAKVGGFKNFSYTKISHEMLQLLLDKSVELELKINNLKKMITPQHDLTSINWALSTDLEILYHLKYIRTRFITNSNKQVFYITLDTNIETTAGQDFQFPYSVMTISYETISQFPSNISSLINSHIVYPMPLEFSVINYINLKFFLAQQDTEFPQWYYDIENVKDIKKMPPQTVTPPQQLPKSILLNQDKKTPFKYWNEFDNGSDFEDDTRGFYVYGDTTISDETIDPILSLNKVNNILQMSNKLVNFWSNLIGKPRLERPIYHKQQSYGSFDSDDTEHEDEDELPLSRYDSPPFTRSSTTSTKNENNRFFLQKIQYDKVMTFIYFFICFISVLINGISIGILYTLLVNEMISNSSSILLCFIFICFFFGLILSISSICLINSRYNDAPKWHYLMNYLVLFLNLGVICLGIKLTTPFII